MNIRRFNEGLTNNLFMRGVYKELMIDVKTEFDLIFIDLIDDNFKSSIERNNNIIIYILDKKMRFDNGFDETIKMFKQMSEIFEDFKIGFTRISYEVERKNILNEYDIKSISYSLVKEVSPNSDTNSAIKIYINY